MILRSISLLALSDSQNWLEMVDYFRGKQKYRSYKIKNQLTIFSDDGMQNLIIFVSMKPEYYVVVTSPTVPS